MQEIQCDLSVDMEKLVIQVVVVPERGNFVDIYRKEYAFETTDESRFSFVNLRDTLIVFGYVPEEVEKGLVNPGVITLCKEGNDAVVSRLRKFIDAWAILAAHPLKDDGQWVLRRV